MRCALLVGLGNPGSAYENNRHNIGFKVIEALADTSASCAFKKMASIVDVAFMSLEDAKLILAKPLTFMNSSGSAVRFLMDFYKVSSDDLYVFHDDIDLEFGRIKIKQGGSSGGHNGLKSIDGHSGNNYWRIRIGVGRPIEHSMVSSYVLSNFSHDQIPIMDSICQRAASHIHLLLSDKKQFVERLHAND